MRKSNKNVLANALKSYVNPVHASELQMFYMSLMEDTCYTVYCGRKSTYDDVINDCVSYVVTNYGNEAIVCSDGYGDRSNSTKFAEQCRRITGKNVTPDIIFELKMSVTCSQTDFLGNHKNKSRFTSALIASLTHSDIKCSQSQANADFLICNSAIELAVILIGKYTDLLVMLIDRSYPN